MGFWILNPLSGGILDFKFCFPEGKWNLKSFFQKDFGSEILFLQKGILDLKFILQKGFWILSEAILDLKCFSERELGSEILFLKAL